jgi:hypothetical protein
VCPQKPFQEICCTSRPWLSNSALICDDASDAKERGERAQQMHVHLILPSAYKETWRTCMIKHLMLPIAVFTIHASAE